MANSGNYLHVYTCGECDKFNTPSCMMVGLLDNGKDKISCEKFHEKGKSYRTTINVPSLPQENIEDVVFDMKQKIADLQIAVIDLKTKMMEIQRNIRGMYSIMGKLNEAVNSEQWKERNQ